MKRTLFSFAFVLAFFAMAPVSAHARGEHQTNPEDDIHVMIVPVIGYQSLDRSYPYDHHEGMLTYGARVVVGTYRLAGEGELQYGSASESFASPAISTDTSLLQVRLGARTIVPIIEEFQLIFRAGMQGSHYSNDVSSIDPTTGNSVTASDSPAWQFRPYVGAGVIFYLFKALSLSVEEVYVVDTSWETAFGFRLFI